MSSNQTHSAWHDIGCHPLCIRGCVPDGYCGTSIASLTLTADSILAHTGALNTPAAIGFHATVSLPTSYSDTPLKYSRVFGCYGSFWDFRDQLTSIRCGQKQTASLHGAEGFELSLIQHDEFGICVRGKFHDPLYISPDWPSDAHALADSLARVQYGYGHSFDFTFAMPVVDPPHLDKFLQETNELLSLIESLD